ncbi:MAG: RDD family protein [Pseudomonadota bacterium]
MRKPAVPDYASFHTDELYQSLDTIREDLYPENYAALTAEIDKRSFKSRLELERCYKALNEHRFPDRRAALVEIYKQLPTPESAAAAVTKPSAKKTYNTWWRRLWALLIDYVCVFAVYAAVMLPLLLTGVMPQSVGDVVGAFSGIMFIAYFVWCHAAGGKTVGKHVVGVRVMDAGESCGITWRQSIVREIVPIVGYVIGSLLLIHLLVSPSASVQELRESGMMIGIWIMLLVWDIANILTPLFNKRRRALHDFIARTVVVRQRGPLRPLDEVRS